VRAASSVLLKPTKHGIAAFDELHGRRRLGEAFLWAFDLLELNGADLRSLPFGKRKARLARLIAVELGPTGLHREEPEICSQARTDRAGPVQSVLADEGPASNPRIVARRATPTTPRQILGSSCFQFQEPWRWLNCNSLASGGYARFPRLLALQPRPCRVTLTRPPPCNVVEIIARRDGGTGHQQ
jgi:hypothetical protein